MNCHEYRMAVIGSWTTGPAGRVETAERVEHRSSCPQCRLFSARYEMAEHLLAQPAANALDRRPRPGFAAGVVAALPERTSPLTWVALRLLPATTALALTLLGWCWLATPTPGELWTQAGESELLTWVLGENGDDG
jgi:hypothetical protein